MSEDRPSNRVDPGVQARLSEIALGNLDGELSNLEAMMKAPATDKTGIEGAKENTFRANQIKSQMYLIKLMAQFASGAVHPTKGNTVAEKKAAEDAVASAKKALDAKVQEWADRD